MALGKVFSFGPTFRAEKSKTRRHLIEFWMIEPEMAFYDFEDSLKVSELLPFMLTGMVFMLCVVMLFRSFFANQINNEVVKLGIASTLIYF